MFDVVDGSLPVAVSQLPISLSQPIEAVLPSEMTLDAALRELCVLGRESVTPTPLVDAPPSRIEDILEHSERRYPGILDESVELDTFALPTDGVLDLLPHSTTGYKALQPSAFDDVDGDGVEDGPTVVTGTPYSPEPIFPPTGSPDGGTGGGTPGGAGTGWALDTAHQQKEDANDTSCVNQIPDAAGGNLDLVNDLAKHMATRLAALQESTGWEWGAVIYRALNGQLYQSDPFTAQNSNSISGAIVRLPVGAVIVGYIHTHPVDALDQRLVSDADREFIQNLESLTGAIRADPNMLVYIVTKDESAQYHAYVYDKSERDSESPGCTL